MSSERLLNVACGCWWMAAAACAPLVAATTNPAALGAPPVHPDVTANQLQDADPAAYANAITALRESLAADARVYAVTVYKARLPDALLRARRFDDAAEVCLTCAIAIPSQTGRAAYFLTARARASLAAGRPDEALAAAKSLYNLCEVASSPRAIDLVAECLAAARTNDPGLVARFRLQQLSAVPPDAAPSDGTGEAVLSGVAVDPSLYPDAYLRKRRDTEWGRVGRANLMLMADHPADAEAVFSRLLSSKSVTVRNAAVDGLARAAKASSGRVASANLYLSRLDSGPPVPGRHVPPEAGGAEGSRGAAEQDP